jgi:hypothetical protein
MTPKEKAKELVDKYLRTYPIYNNPTVVISYTHNEAKQCALIAVDELIKEAYFTDAYIKSVFFTDGYYDKQEYWQEIKKEIENL